MITTKFSKALSIFILAISGIVTSSEITIAASFQGLGSFADSNTYVIANDVSADGSVVVGDFSRFEIEGYIEGFIWNRNDNSITMLGDLLGSEFSSSTDGISADGSIIVGSRSGVDGSEAFIWNRNNGITEIGIPDTDYNFAMDVSDDGSTVVGFGGEFSEAFVWDKTNGITDSVELFGGEYFLSRAHSVSGDGSIVVGTSSEPNYGGAFAWDRTNGVTWLGDLPGGIVSSSANSISSDGSTIVGTSRGANGREAFVLDGINEMIGLGDFPGGDYSSSALDVSGDGSIVIGSGKDVNGNKAFIWDSSDGMRSLQDVLVDEFNLDLTGWNLQYARAISDDGSTIIGSGINPDGKEEAWIATLDRNESQSVLEPFVFWSYVIFGLGAMSRRLFGK